MSKTIRIWLGHLYAMALRFEARNNGFDRAENRRIIEREVSAIPDSLRAHHDYQSREQAIQNDRMTRRFDMGLALNEAANRAIAEKTEAKRAVDPGMNLSANQSKALEFQKQYLDSLVKRA